MPAPEEVAFYSNAHYIIFGETPVSDGESKYLYEVSGSAPDHDLNIYVTDMQQQGWGGHCKLQSLKAMVSDISPDEGQMLNWIVSAAKSNEFAVVHDKGLAHLKAQIKAGGFTINIRLPPEDNLEHAANDIQARNFDLAFHLLKQHQQQDEVLARKETEANESKSKVKELQEQVHQLESRLSNVQLALKQAQAKTTSQTQQFTASVSSMDAMSPSQSLQASPGGGHKKPRSEQTQAMSGQRSPAQDARAGGTLDSGAAAQSGSDYAASPSGQQTASRQSEPQNEEGTGAVADSEVIQATAPRVGQARVVARGRGRGRGRGRQATKIGG